MCQNRSIKTLKNILHQTLDDTIEKQVEEKEYPTVLKEEEKLTVRLEDMGMGRKKKLGSGSDISKEERIACEEAQGLCANLLVAVSLLLVFATLPLSLCFVIKVVQASKYFHYPLSNIALSSFLGIRASSHLSTRPSSFRRGPRPWSLFCHSLCGCVSEDRYENSNL